MKTANLIKLPIEGMTCASCVARVEKALCAVPGVGSAEVNLATETATVSYAEGAAPSALLDAVRAAGYEARLGGDPRPAGQADRSWWPVAASAVLTLPLVLPMLAEGLGASWMLPGWIQLLLATPVQFWLGARFYRGGWKALRARSGNMDLLVALGTSAAYGLSVYTARAPLAITMPHYYFETGAGSSRWCCWASGWRRARSARPPRRSARCRRCGPGCARAPRRHRGRGARWPRSRSATRSWCGRASASPWTGDDEGRIALDESLITGESCRWPSVPETVSPAAP
jgi:P-type Cu+ transporter